MDLPLEYLSWLTVRQISKFSTVAAFRLLSFIWLESRYIRYPEAGSTLPHDQGDYWNPHFMFIVCIL